MWNSKLSFKAKEVKYSPANNFQFKSKVPNASDGARDVHVMLPDEATKAACGKGSQMGNFTVMCHMGSVKKDGA